MNFDILTSTKEISREEWLDWRRKGIGGSDVSAILGLNKWKSPVAVYLDKIGELEKTEQSESAYWGTVLEEIVAKEFSQRTGLKVKRKNAILSHPDYPFMLANIDRLIVGEKAGLECKTSSEYRKNEWSEDSVPEEYILQCQHYMAVTGFEKWYIAVLIGGNKFMYKLIERDEEIINYLIEVERDFWEKVENRIPPEVDGSSASSELLKKLYPSSIDGTEILLPSNAVELIRQRDELKAQDKELSEKIDEIENKLKQLLQDNEIGVCDGYKVIWKTQSRTSIDSKKLKAEQPEIYNKYLNTSSYRKFEIKELKA